MNSAWRKHLAVVRYVATSVGVYVYVLAALFVLVDWLHVPEVPAYIAVYAGAYVMEYLATMRLVFAVQHRWAMVLKYVIYVSAFLLINTLLYAQLLRWDVHYMAAALLVAVLLMPARYLVNKHWVYR
jgi:putative flippase GtrA